jgi:hypothetical protein
LQVPRRLHPRGMPSEEIGEHGHPVIGRHAEVPLPPKGSEAAPAVAVPSGSLAKQAPCLIRAGQAGCGFACLTWTAGRRSQGPEGKRLTCPVRVAPLPWLALCSPETTCAFPSRPPTSRPPRRWHAGSTSAAPEPPTAAGSPNLPACSHGHPNWLVVLGVESDATGE